MQKRAGLQARGTARLRAVGTALLNGLAAEEGARRHALRRPAAAIDPGRASRNAEVAPGTGGGARSC